MRDKTLEKIAASRAERMKEAGYSISDDDIKEVHLTMEEKVAAEIALINAQTRRRNLAALMLVIVGVVGFLVVCAGLTWMVMATTDRGEPQLDGVKVVQHGEHSYIVVFGKNRYGEAFTEVIHDPDCKGDEHDP